MVALRTIHMNTDIPMLLSFSDLSSTNMIEVVWQWMSVDAIDQIMYKDRWDTFSKLQPISTAMPLSAAMLIILNICIIL